MKLLNQTLSEITAHRTISKYPALTTHVVLGYPTLEKSIEIVQTMAQAGAKIIEVQIPFSDPIADGATIMFANQQALNSNVTPSICLEALSQITKTVNVPILVMSYFNIPFSYKGGLANFCKAAHDAGAEGLIIPDVPPEEDSIERLSELSEKNSLHLIPLVSPLSTAHRLQKISSVYDKGGFVYCVSTTGTTGARKDLPTYLDDYTKRVRKYFNKPLALGFGISSQAQVKAVGEYVEIAIVGSATIDILRNADPKTSWHDQLNSIKNFIQELASHKVPQSVA